VNLAVTTLVCFVFFAREAAGATGTRHSPRPLLFEAVDFLGMTRARCVAGMISSCPDACPRLDRG
jgi:hypothetical protein